MIIFPMTIIEPSSLGQELLSNLLSLSSSILTPCQFGRLSAVTRSHATLSGQIFSRNNNRTFQEGFAFNTCLWRENLSERQYLRIIQLYFNFETYSIKFLYFEGSCDEIKWRISNTPTILRTRTLRTCIQRITHAKPDYIQQSTTNNNNKNTQRTFFLRSRESILFTTQSITAKPQKPKIYLLIFFQFQSLVRVTNQSCFKEDVYEQP